MQHFSLMAKITREHGGMTRACFRRSNAIASMGESVTILSVNIEPDLEGLVAHIREHSELGNVPVRNMHTDFALGRFRPSSETAKRFGLSTKSSAFRSIEGLTPRAAHEESATRDFGVREWVDEDGVILRIELFDLSERLFFVEERKAYTANPRRLTLLDPESGEPIVQGGSFAFQQAWVDSLITEEATITIDGVAPGEALASYTNPKVLKYLIQHSVHQRTENGLEMEKLNPRVVTPFRENHHYDGFVTLTRQQAIDLRERVDPACKVVTIPNVNPEPQKTAEPRDPNLCVIVSRIEESNKRITHMLRALRVAHERNSNLRAEIYGGPLSGKAWELARSCLAELELEDVVRFFGHTEGAANNFARAGFTVMTSRFEGQGLVLVEAMSRGAIPAAYDIPYGPGDVITSGKTGYLVADGDFEALGNRMSELSLPTREVDEMREAAIRESERFRADTIARSWLQLFTADRASTPERERLRGARAEALEIQFPRGGNVRLECELHLPLSREERKDVTVALRGVDHHDLSHATIQPTKVKASRDGVRATFDIEPAAVTHLARRDIAAWIRVSLGNRTMDVRLGWNENWAAWPARSPTGRLNLR